MTTQQQEEIINNSESKVSMKVESNSRGFNTTVHVYEGCSKEQIEDTITKTIYAHNGLQKALIQKGEKIRND